MEIIEGATLPFIVDNSTAKKQNDKITSYKTYETHRKDKCLELVNLLNELNDENKQLKQAISDWKGSYDELYENCGKLEKKNEQLKSEIVHLENKLAYKDQHNNNDFKGIEDWASGGF